MLNNTNLVNDHLTEGLMKYQIKQSMCGNVFKYILILVVCAIYNDQLINNALLQKLRSCKPVWNALLCNYGKVVV